MPPKRERIPADLADAIHAVELMTGFVVGMTEADYCASEFAQSAVERQLQILGESLNRLRMDGPEIAERVPDLHEIIGMRNHLVHGYDAIVDWLVWQTVAENVPELVAVLRALLEELAE